MAQTVKILAIAGSLSRGSWNKGALRAARELCPAGAQIEIYDLEGLPLAEYNYGIPGVLKNALDVASRPYGDSAWSGKPVAIMSAAMSMGGGVRAQYQLRQCFVFLNMDAVVQPEVAIGNAQQRFDAESNLTDETSRKLIAQLLKNLVDKVRILRPGLKQAA